MLFRQSMKALTIAAFMGATALTCVAPGTAQGVSERQPWEWTTEERLEALSDPALSQARRAETEALGNVHEPPVGGGEAVIGRHHPELFFVHELFDSLLSQVYASDEEARGAWRLVYEEEVADLLGPPDQVWEAIESVSRDYLWSLHRARELAQGLEEATPMERQQVLAHIDEVQAPQCALRIQALQAARKALGAASFDRFLYTAVASRSFKTYGTSFSAEKRAIIRWVAEGCR